MNPVTRSRPRITARIKREGGGTIHFSISLQPSVHAHLLALARKNDVSISRMVSLLVVRATKDAVS